MLHDVGKLVIATEVLNKPGPLTPIEWELVKQHPVHGAEMLADVDFPWDVRPIVESHHERWDGEGYPHGLVGEEIPLTARILCIADVYDALTSQRSYKRPLSHQEALDVMRHDVGHQFDPGLFPAFEEVSGELARTRGGVRAPATRPRLDGVGGGAETDELTGLPLRRAFLERARAELRSRPSAVSLLVIDVDHFKLINDTYGHLAGDEVLRELAGAWRSGAGSRNCSMRASARARASWRSWERRASGSRLSYARWPPRSACGPARWCSAVASTPRRAHHSRPGRRCSRQSGCCVSSSIARGGSCRACCPMREPRRRRQQTERASRSSRRSPSTSRLPPRRVHS